MDVSVVIPTYNERENIADLVPAVADQLADREFEIIIVDDNSPDGTADHVEQLGDDRVRVVRRERKQGLGSAYKDGFTVARGTVIVQMDADFSHDPVHLPALVDAVENGYDVAVGSRYVAEGSRNDPLHRRVFPLIGSYLYRYGIGVPVRDVTSGFKAYQRAAVATLPVDDLPDGFHFQAASLLSLLDAGLQATEVPIDFGERRNGDPKYGVRDLIDNLVLFGEAFLKKRQRMLKFAAVGASGIVVNMGLLALLTEIVGLYYAFSSVFAVEAAILWNFVFNERWTFEDRGASGVAALAGRLAKYNMVSLVGLALNVGILVALTELAGIHYLLANLLAIVTVFAWNYGVNERWTWQGDL